jgi:hypothetical protein
MLINGSALNEVAINGDTQLDIRALCELARGRVEVLVKRDIGQDVRLTEINKDVLNEAKAWRRKYGSMGRASHEPGWDWSDEYYRRGRKTSGVTLAMWFGDQLCGLMIGQVSDGRLHATIHFLEGNPEGNPLKGNVVVIATGYLEAIGALVGCEVVRIASPIPELVPHYKSFGYTIEQRKNKAIKFLDKRMPGAPVDASSNDLPV